MIVLTKRSAKALHLGAMIGERTVLTPDEYNISVKARVNLLSLSLMKWVLSFRKPLKQSVRLRAMLARRDQCADIK